ncbi:MAG: hypothetical protein VW270_05260 [Candidatus Poseidoniales archaeon]
MKVLKLLCSLVLLSFLTGCFECTNPLSFEKCEEVTSTSSSSTTTPPTPGYTFSASSINVAENAGTGTYTVKLNTQPTSTVTVAISSADTTEITVSPSSLSFTTSNYSTAQTVTLTGVNDNVSDGNQSISITNSFSSSDSDYAALDNKTVTAVNVDDDTVAFTLSSLSSTNMAEGATDTYTIVLGSQPTADVIVSVSSSNSGQISVSPDNVTFSSGNYSTSQTITLTATDDNIDDGDISVTITNSISTADSDYSGLSNQTVSVVNVDNDTAAITLTETSSSTAVVESGSTDNFTVVLASEPTDNVTVTVTASDSTELSVSPSTLTFTSSNWSTTQEVTVTGVEDNVVDGSRWADLSFSVSSSDSKYSGMSISSITSIPVTDSRTGRQQNSYISAGLRFYLAVDNTTGTVYAWGDDTCNGSNFGHCDYQRENGLDNLSAVATYGGIGRSGSGPIYPNLGDNSTHLGDNSTSTPIAMPSVIPTNPFQVESNTNWSCVMNSTRDNTSCWGRINYESAFGTANSSTIWNLSHSVGAFYDLAIHGDGGCALNSDRTVSCWGYGRHGQYGDGTIDYNADLKTASITNVVDLAAGGSHICAVVDNGTAWCWGRDDGNQLGNNAAADTSQISDGGSSTPQAVHGGITNFIQIEAYTTTSCAVTDNGTVWCWGNNTVGQLGDGTTTSRDYPVQVQNITDALEVYVGNGIACATVNKRLDLKCWGNYYLGDGSSTASSTPVTVTETNGWGADYTFDDVAVGQSSICAYNLANNEAFCWGNNGEGQLGLGNTLTPERTMQDVSSPF